MSRRAAGIASTGEVERRLKAPTKRRGCTASSSARGAQPPTVNGPLQRLLGGTPVCWVMHTVMEWHLSKIKGIHAIKTTDVISILVRI